MNDLVVMLKYLSSTMIRNKASPAVRSPVERNIRYLISRRADEEGEDRENNTENAPNTHRDKAIQNGHGS